MGLGIKVTEWNANYSLNEMEFPPRSQLSNDLATGFGKKKKCEKIGRWILLILGCLIFVEPPQLVWSRWFWPITATLDGPVLGTFHLVRQVAADHVWWTLSSFLSLSATKYLVFCLIFEVNAFRVDYFLLMKTTNFFQGNIFLKMATWLFKWSDHFSKTL